MNHPEEINQFLLRWYNKRKPNHPYLSVDSEFLDELVEDLEFRGTFEDQEIKLEKWQTHHHESDIYVIIKIGDRYFKYTGWFSSWNGAEWSTEPVEVFPRTETVVHFD